MAILDVILAFLPSVAILSLFLWTWFTGSKKAKKHLEQVNETLKSALAPHTKGVDGPIKLRTDIYEYRCKPKNPHIGVLTVNYSTLNQTMFPNPQLNKLFKSKEKLFIGLKFRTDGRDINPSYKFYLVPYRKKMLIRQNFEEYVALDDVPTANKSVDRNFMVKSGSELELEHIAQNKELMDLIDKYADHIDIIQLKKAKEKTDPHLQATFYVKPDELNIINDLLSIFFAIADLHIENHERVTKMVSMRKTRTVVKKTKSAKAHRGGKKRAESGVEKKERVTGSSKKGKKGGKKGSKKKR